MSLDQQAAVSNDPLFQGRCQMSTYRAANAVAGEDWQTANYSQAKADKRHQLAVTILGGSKGAMQSFFDSVAAQIGDVADQSTLTDGQIDTAVDSVFDDIAGVTFEENVPV
jgi:hypothetical protein